MKNLLVFRVLTISLFTLLVTTSAQAQDDCAPAGCVIGGGVSETGITPRVYLPLLGRFCCVTGGFSIITLVDQTDPGRLPISWTFTDIGNGDIVASGERIGAQSPRVWSFRVKEPREYRLTFDGRRGDTCTNRVERIIERYHYLEGACSFWRVHGEDSNEVAD